MRTCIRCGLSKDDSEFNWRNINKGYLQSVCRDCQAQNSRNRDRENVRVSNKASRERGVERAQEYVYKYLSTKACADCGERDITVLTFHHTDARNKKYKVADMISHGYAIETIQSEIDRCEVLCYNCHVRREADARGKGKKFWLFL
jgi:hypothetical protein